MKNRLKIGAIALTIYGLIQFGHDRLFLLIRNGTQSQAGRSRRLALRFSTASRVTKNVVGLVLVVVVFLVSLSRLGLDLGPLLAGARIIGLALSFASQNMLKDVINGCLILLEDQFGVGDVIIVGPVSGFMENMNLRITQLRNEEGRLITMILGVDQLNHEDATVRLWIMTQSLKQWEVAREYRRRIKVAFDQSRIDIGLPQQRLHIHSAESSAAASESSKSELVHS